MIYPEMGRNKGYLSDASVLSFLNPQRELETNWMQIF
jgi:hypothetical protein